MPLLLACLPELVNPPPRVEAALSLGAAPGCADPGARERLGPFTLVESGDWAQQPEGGPPNFTAWGLSVADFDGDGALDIFLPTFTQDRLYVGEPGPSWRDATAARLPGEPDTPSFASAAADSDGDGDLDLAVSRRGGVSLYTNDGAGKLSRALDFPISSFEIYHLAWGDLNGDGLPELFVGTFYPDDDAALPDPNALYLNLGGNRFEDISPMLGEMARVTPANAGGFLDIDQDGDQDLYVVNDKPHAGFRSVLLENLGDGELSYDQNRRGLDAAVLGMGLGVGDLNDDGWDDLAITGWDEHALLLSAGDGTWYNAAGALGFTTDSLRVVGWSVELVDIDNDGDLDAAVAYGPDYDASGNLGGEGGNPATQPPGLYLNSGGQFIETSLEYGIDLPGVYRGLVVADLNRDGFPDLVARDIHSRSKLWLSRCDDRGWLSVTLRAPNPNAFALGARVRVYAGGRAMERVVFAGSTGLASSGPTELLFGLGEAHHIDRLEVIWPDGARSRFEDLPADAPLTITR